MALYKATIEILLDVNNFSEACDALNESLRPMLKRFSDDAASTAFIDWRFSNNATFVKDSGEGFEYASKSHDV